MAPFRGVPTEQQQIVLAITPKVTAALSLLGSSYIAYDCGWASRVKKSGRTTFHNLMLGLAVSDLFMSTGLFTSTWGMPHDTPNVWGAKGTTATCAAVGFLEQAGEAAVLYNGSLSVYYVLRIRFGWSTSRLRKLEWWLHGVPIVFALATMVASLQLDLFNSGLFDCWIAPFPQGCEQSWQHGGETTCERGDNASLYQWLFDLIPKWSSILMVTVNMWLTYRGILQQERNTMRYSHRLKPRVAKRLARQSYFYVGALYLTYIPVIITRLTELIAGHVYYEMLLTISITIPLQGFWNVLVYLRPRYLREREKQRSERLRIERNRSQNNAPEKADSSNAGIATSTRFGSFQIVRAVSEAVKDGCLSDEEDDNEEKMDDSLHDETPQADIPRETATNASSLSVHNDQ